MTVNDFVSFIGRSLAIIVPLLIWSLIWKGFALWRAATRRDKVWFIVLLLVNTFGLLEILYLFVFSKRELAAQTPALMDEPVQGTKE
ncbi:MAG: DUF5652 family protein [Candidatus Andersenbacteria bacterium]